MHTYKTDDLPTYHLTRCQKRFLEQVASGFSIKEIAIADDITENTVKGMASRTRHVLGARSTAQAVAIAIVRGLINVPLSDPHEEALRCLLYLKEYLEKPDA